MSIRLEASPNTHVKIDSHPPRNALYHCHPPMWGMGIGTHERLLTACFLYILKLAISRRESSKNAFRYVMLAERKSSFFRAAAKLVQAERNTKLETQFLFFIAEAKPNFAIPAQN